MAKRYNKNICIIPARRDSEQIPQKNSKEIAGKPLIVWTIETALASEIFDTILVTTNDNHIIKIAETYEIQIKLRDERLSGKDSLASDVIMDVIKSIPENPNIFYLQPTSPARGLKCLRQALFLLNETQNIGKSVVGVKKANIPLPLLGRINVEGEFNRLLSDDVKNRQEFETCYQINGAIYAADRNSLMLNRGNYLKSKIIPVIMNEQESIDIDSNQDWKYAEKYLIKINHKIQ